MKSYKGYKYYLSSFLDTMWNGDVENMSGVLAVRLPLRHGVLVSMVLERDHKPTSFKENVRDKSKWLKGYIHFTECDDDTCELRIPINENLITVERVIDEIDQIIADVSH